ncbi:MAG: acyltransferase [Planctomycetes bacterium]|nr:acyltransferase [Planctomycetota bacterium]
MNQNIKVASVQFNHHAGDIAYNLEQITHFTQEAATENVELILFPEMCITGYWHVRNLSRDEIVGLAEEVPAGPSCQRLISLSKTHNMTVSAGLIEIDEQGRLFNTQFVAMPNGTTASHRKLHCFINQHMDHGTEHTVFELPNGIKVGLLICYDNNIIENPRMIALQGADILLAPHQTGGCHTPSPRLMGKIDVELWENRGQDPEAIEAEFKGSKGRGWLVKWLPARAHDNGMFVVFSNGVGRDDDEVRTGNAMIIDAYGDILSETWAAKDDMVIANCDLSMREQSTGWRWITSRRPDLYGPLSEFTGIEEDVKKVRFAFKNE